jgi:hypothetical protein
MSQMLFGVPGRLGSVTMIIKYTNGFKEYHGLSTDDYSYITENGAIVYFVDTQNRVIYHDGQWHPFILPVMIRK